MKTTLKILLFTSVMVLLILLLASCSNLFHTCTPGRIETSVIYDSTCCEEGEIREEVYCSECDKSLEVYYRRLPTIEHEASEEKIVDYNTYISANCACEGSYDELSVCKWCDQVIGRKTVTIPKITNHNDHHVEYTSYVEYPTCTTEGTVYVEIYCYLCDVVVREYTKTEPMIDHTPADVVIENKKAPTCTSTGSCDEVVYCSHCYVELERTSKILPILDHEPDKIVIENNVDPTCTSNGSYDEVTYCKGCSLELDRINKIHEILNHVPAEAIVENTVAATCTSTGSYDEVLYCKDCGAEISRINKVIPMISHNPADAVIENIVEVTCLVNGGYESVVYCIDCNSEISRDITVIPMLPHTVVSGICSVCDSIVGNTGLVYTLNGDSYSLTGYGTCTDMNIVIPSTYNGKPVTLIEGNAFKNCSKIRSIVVPDSVTSIGRSAFYGCSSLRTITLPFVGGSLNNTTNVNFGYIFGASDYQYNSTYVPQTLSTVIITGGQSIGSRAFYNLTGIKSITLPESVTSIAYGAFYGCTNLTNITMTDSVTSIGDYAFYGCSKLESIDLSDNIQAISINLFEGCSSLTSVNIPQSVTSIGSYAFKGCSKLVDINIPYGIDRINSETFYGCSSLKNIIIPNSVQSISKGAFEGCTSLESITVPYLGSYHGASYASLNTCFGYIFGYTTGSSSDYHYYGSSNYYKFNIPASLKTVTVSSGTIYSSSFKNCSNITNIILLEGVTDISSSAFEGCTSLTDIYIPNSVKYFYSDSFKDCKNLSNVHISSIDAWCDIDSFWDNPLRYGAKLCVNGEAIDKIVIPESVTEIKYNAFNHISASEVVILGNVTKIGKNAFINSKIGKINLPETLEIIDESAFANCRFLTEIVIPNSVTNIGFGAFSGCDKIQKMTLPFVGESSDGKGATYVGYIFGCSIDYKYKQDSFVPASLKSVVINGFIGSGAFEECNNIETVVISGATTTIGSRAFCRCRSLTTVTILDGVTTIGYDSFEYCYNLSEITIPKSMTTIGNEAFYSCSKLKVVNNWSDLKFTKGTTLYGYIAYYADVVNVYNDSEVSIDGLIFISNPEGNYLIRYDGTETSITLPESYNGEAYIIDSYAFCNSSVTSIIIPEGMIEILNYAFSGSSIESITIPSTVTYIGDHAFTNCRSLRSVVFADGIQLPGIYAGTFEGCISLRSVTIPDGVEYIYPDAFKNCESLQSVEFPDSLINIHDRAFYGCKSLQRLTLPVNLVSIGQNAFGGCTSLYSIDFNEGVGLHNKAFEGCISLKSIYLPENVKLYNYGAFAGCSNIKYISIAGSINIGHIGELFGYEVYTDKPAFYHEQVTLSDGQAFYYVFDIPNLLASVTIHNIDVVDYMFQNVTSLEVVYFASDFQGYIGEGAFIGCTSLVSVEFDYDSCLTRIGASAFQNCSSLDSIVIGSNVRSIGSYAFYGCSSLKSVEFKSTYGWKCVSPNNTTQYFYLDKDLIANKGIAARYLMDEYYKYYQYQWIKN